MDQHQEELQAEWNSYQNDQEELQAQWNSYQNEFQAAYDLSQTSRQPDDRGRVRALVNAGRYVVVEHVECFCRYTDASLGDDTVYVSDHATRHEADLAANAGQRWGPGPDRAVPRGPRARLRRRPRHGGR